MIKGTDAAPKLFTLRSNQYTQSHAKDSILLQPKNESTYCDKSINDTSQIHYVLFAINPRCENNYPASNRNNNSKQNDH